MVVIILTSACGRTDSPLSDKSIEDLRNYNLTMTKKLKAVSSKSLDELAKATDEIGKVEYAKKLLGIDISQYDRFLIAKYNNAKAKEAIEILEKLANEGNQYANLALAELYFKGNSRCAGFAVCNMPVDFDAQKTRKYAEQAIKISTEKAFTGFAYKILGDLNLYKKNALNSALNGYFLKTSEIDSAIKNYKTALKYGNSDAAFWLFLIYNGIPISYDESLVEPDKKRAKLFLKISADWGDLKAIDYYLWKTIYRSPKDWKQNIATISKYIKQILDTNRDCLEIYGELAAILAENNQLEGYTPQDAKSIREKIPVIHYYTIMQFYETNVFESKDGLAYWSKIQMEIKSGEKEKINESLKEHVRKQKEFLDYFKSLPRTKENRFFCASASLHYSYAIRTIDDKEATTYSKNAYNEFIALANEGYHDAIIKLAGNVSFKGVESYQKKKYRQLAKNLKLPIYSFQIDSDYVIKTYNETHDDGFLYGLSGNMNKDLIEFYAENAKDNEHILNWAAYNLLKCNPEKQPELFEKVVRRLKHASKSSNYNKSDVKALLSYAYSGLNGMPKDDVLSQKYANETGYNIRNYYHTYHFNDIDETAIASLNLYIDGISCNPAFIDGWGLHRSTLHALRETHKKNPKNIKITFALAHKEKEEGNYKEAYSIYLKLHKKFPPNLNFIAPLAEFNYYGLGIEQNKELGEKYYQKIFDSAKSGNNDAFEIILNLVSHTRNVDYYDGKIPADIVARNLKDIPEHLMKTGYLSHRFIDFFRDNKMEDLAKELEDKYLAFDPNIIANKARALIRKNTPESDKKAVELYEQIWKKGNTFIAEELGAMYFTGRGVKQDYKKAFEIFNEAKDDSTGFCYAWLALMYKMGYGVEKSEEKTNECINILDDTDPKGDMLNSYGRQLIYGHSCYLGFSTAPKCVELGVELMKRSALKGLNPAGLSEYAELLEEGKYVKQDFKQATELYEKSARISKIKDYDYYGFERAIRLLKLSKNPTDHTKAYKLAQEWLNLAPDSINAKTEMALLLMSGIGVEKNPQKAVEYLNKAITSTLQKDQYLWRAYGVLAYCYMKGIGVEKDEQKLRELISQIYKVKVRRCKVLYKYLEYAKWFNPNIKPTDLDVVENPLLPADKELTLFWMNEYEKVADNARNIRFKLPAYKRLIKFFSTEKGFENSQKVEVLKQKLEKAKLQQATKANKKNKK